MIPDEIRLKLMEFCKHISPFIMKACSPLSQPCMFSHLTHHPMLCVCVVPATINTALLLFGKPLVLTKLAQHPSLPCALLRIFSYLNPFSELLSLFPSLSAFVTIPLSLSFCHYSPLSLSFSLLTNAGRRVAESMRR